MAAGTCGLAGLRPWGPAGQALQPSSRWLLRRRGRAVETDLSGGSGHWLVLSGQPSSCRFHQVGPKRPGGGKRPPAVSGGARAPGRLPATHPLGGTPGVAARGLSRGWWGAQGPVRASEGRLGAGGPPVLGSVEHGRQASHFGQGPPASTGCSLRAQGPCRSRQAKRCPQHWSWGRRQAGRAAWSRGSFFLSGFSH